MVQQMIVILRVFTVNTPQGCIFASSTNGHHPHYAIDYFSLVIDIYLVEKSRDLQRRYPGIKRDLSPCFKAKKKKKLVGPVFHRELSG